jgi:hypothetical protein
MNKWQAGYYHQNGQEIVWKSFDARSLRNAMRLADQWVETTFNDTLPMSMIVVAQETSDTVTALRYLDDHEWVLSGKGIVAGLKHKMAR